MKKVFGITGETGVGKSFAGHFFKNKGAVFIEADEVVGHLYQIGNPGYLLIKKYFGERFLNSDKSLNRKKMIRFFFQDEKKVEILNNLIHPLVYQEILKKIKVINDKLVFIEAVYFNENGLGKLVDSILYITADKDKSCKRALKNGITKSTFEEMVRAQHKPKKVNHEIQNNGTIKHFENELEKFWNMINV